MILKAILCFQHFCCFGATLLIVNLHTKLISLLFVFLACLGMFAVRHYLQLIADLENGMLTG